MIKYDKIRTIFEGSGADNSVFAADARAGLRLSHLPFVGTRRGNAGHLPSRNERGRCPLDACVKWTSARALQNDRDLPNKERPALHRPRNHRNARGFARALRSAVPAHLRVRHAA